MSMKHHRGPDYGPKMAAHIETVDPKKRIIQARLKDGGIIQITTVGISTTFIWPKVGEYWLVRKDTGHWKLDSKYDLKTDFTVENLQPGEARIAADAIYDAAGNRVKVTQSVATTLPSSPYANQEIYYLADSDDRTIWHLKYNATLKNWDYLGGGPVTAATDTNTASWTTPPVGTSSSLWTSTWNTTPLLSHSIPLAGKYQISYAATMAPTGSINATSAYCSLGIAIKTDNVVLSGSEGYFYTDMHNSPIITAARPVAVTYDLNTVSTDRFVKIALKFYSSSNWYTANPPYITNQTLSIQPVGTLSNWA